MAGGNTTINLAAAGTIAANPAITNVAVLNVRASATSTMDANAGYTTITSTNSTAQMNFTAIRSAATLGFSGFGTALATGGAGNPDVSFTYASGALGSATATQALSFGGVGTSSSRPIVTITTAGNDVIRTMNIAATGFNAITTVNTNNAQNAWQTVETMNISGTGSFRVAGGSNTLANVKTINAATNTGGVNIDLATGGNTQAVTFTGGTGNDRVAFAAAAFDANDVLDMGTGTNTLALGDGTISIANTPNLVTAIKAVKGLTALELTFAGATGSLAFNANNIGLSSYTISGSSTAAAGANGAAATNPGATGGSAVTVSGELNTQVFTISASQTGGAGGNGNTSGAGGAGGTAVTVTANLDNGTNALSVTLGSSTAGITLTGGVGGTGGATAGSLGGAGGVAFEAGNFETVNLTVQGGALALVSGSGGTTGAGGGGASGAAGAGITLGTNATLNISGNQDMNLGAVSGSNVSVIAASGFSNAISVATLTGNTTVTTGSGNDIINMVAAATGTVNSGAGNDVVNILGGGVLVTKTNTITATAGVTVVAAGADTHGDIVTLGGGTDTVKFIGDAFINMLQSSAGITRIVSIRDFVAGTDKIGIVSIGAANTSIAFGAASTVATADTLAQVYAGITPIAVSVDGGALSASLVTVSAGARAGTYLYINDATAGVTAADDLLVNITGISGTLSASDFVFA